MKAAPTFTSPSARSLGSAVGGVVLGLLSLSFADPSGSGQRSYKALVLENQQLKQSLVQSNHREDQLATQLADIHKRLGALGKSVLSEDKDDRILTALSEIEYLNQRLSALETSTIALIDNYRDFASSALVSNPDTRNRLEASIRQVETDLGYRHQPERNVLTGTLQQAKIVSVDQESGLVVLNVGHAKDARVGMRFALKRGSLDLATGIIAEVRPSVSGLLVEKVHDSKLTIQAGDSAKVILN